MPSWVRPRSASALIDHRGDDAALGKIRQIDEPVRARRDLAHHRGHHLDAFRAEQRPESVQAQAAGVALEAVESLRIRHRRRDELAEWAIRKMQQ